MPPTIYYIPIQIWEAIGFGFKVGFFFTAFILAFVVVIKDWEAHKSKSGEEE